MIVRKPDRSFCRSTWPPGTWLPPSVDPSMCCRYGTQFIWQVTEDCFFRIFSTNYSKGAIA